MNQAIGVLVTFGALAVADVYGACFYETGCNMPDGFDPTQEWTPENNKCQKCSCSMEKVYFSTCPELFYSVKKSAVGYFIQEEEEIEVPESDKDLYQCDNTISWNVGTDDDEVLIPNGLRMTTYYYYQPVTVCCSVGMSYFGAVPPQCEEIPVDECRTARVLREDNSIPCPESMAMVG